MKPPQVMQAGYVTISWYPGKLKGYSQAETQQIIIEACQQWQSVSGVRFGTLADGQPTRITLYPYTKTNPPWAMATYPSTGQILYATTKKFERDWAVMAFAHEFAHCFGWGHADSKRVESMMHPNGSSVRYFDHIDAQRARRQFGYSSVPYHWPYSLKFVGDKIRAEKKVLAKVQSEFDRWDKTWETSDEAWRKWKAQRDATPRNHPSYEAKNKYTQDWYKRREDSGKQRKAANVKVAASHRKLKPLSDQWLRIKRQWDSIGGIKFPTMAMQDNGPCACFVDDDKPMRASDDLLEAFKDLPKDTVPLELAQ